ncbi:phosphate-starvation-inducible PsiE family protein [Synechococcus elongatus]|uniref:phosphate-starvation-inducible PsiE family protein n=1 Tax=Synechococcus elongatus TaxID=32046 RepID=UPI0030D17331
MAFPVHRIARLGRYWSDPDSFLQLVSKLEKFIAKLLSLAMIVVIIVSTIDLGIFLVQNLFTFTPFFLKTALFEVFGMFLSVLIALEILENITGYLRRNVIQVELVVATSLIAIARKLIILDVNKISTGELFGLGFAVLALAVSYWIVRSAPPRNSHH